MPRADAQVVWRTTMLSSCPVSYRTERARHRIFTFETLTCEKNAHTIPVRISTLRHWQTAGVQHLRVLLLCLLLLVCVCHVSAVIVSSVLGCCTALASAAILSALVLAALLSNVCCSYGCCFCVCCFCVQADRVTLLVSRDAAAPQALVCYASVHKH